MTVGSEALVTVDLQLVRLHTEALVALFEDGFQWPDLFAGIDRSMAIANTLQDISREDRKRFAIAVFQLAYQKADPDISKWIPQWVERRVVNWLLTSILPAAFDWTVKLTKGQLATNQL